MEDSRGLFKYLEYDFILLFSLIALACSIGLVKLLLIVVATSFENFLAILVQY